MARTVTDEHKAAMQHGRQMSSVVDAYLKAIDKPKKRGRQVSLEYLQRRCDQAAAEANSTEGITKLKALQKAADLKSRIDEAQAVETVDLEALEKAFTAVAADYSEAQGIGYSTWREIGVPADVLKRAGIKQTRNRN